MKLTPYREQRYMLLQNTEKLFVPYVLVPQYSFQLQLHCIIYNHLFDIHIYDICLLAPRK